MLPTQVVLKISHHARKFDLPPSNITNICKKPDQAFSKLDKNSVTISRYYQKIKLECSELPIVKNVNLYSTSMKKRFNHFPILFIKINDSRAFQFEFYFYVCVFECVVHKRESDSLELELKIAVSYLGEF